MGQLFRKNSDYRNHEKTKIFEPQIQNWGFFSQGLNFTVAKFCYINLKEYSFARRGKLKVKLGSKEAKLKILP